MDKQTIARNIVRLRKINDITQQNLAQMAGITKSALQNIEKAKTDARSSTLINLAHALKVKVPDLLVETPSFSSVRFRIAKTSTARDRKAREQELIDVALWLNNYRELEEILYEKQNYLLEGKTYREPVESAGQIRILLGLDEKEPVFNITGLCEKIGIKIYFKDSNIKKYFGMSIAKEDGGPAIAVNVRKDISIERQIFTVAHELGHLVLHRNSYNLDIIEEDENEEKEADIFASYFLIPAAGFEKEWRESRGMGLLNRVFHVKRIFKVSYLSVIRRLIDTGQAQTDLYKSFAQLYKAQYKRNLKDHYEPAALNEPEGLLSFDLTESRLHRLVRTAYEKEEISFSRAAEILDLDIEEMRNLASSWKIE